MAFTIPRLVESLDITEDQARQIIALIRREVSPFTVDATAKWADSCYHAPDPGKPETILHAIDRVLGTCGAEAIFSERYSCTQPVLEYCNTGDTYATTIAYDYVRGKYLLTSWGDWVERHGRRYGLD